MQTIKNFARRLCSERKRLGLTQAQFADACGVKAASQFLYEKAERSPNAEYLLKAADLGVRISFIFEGATAEHSYANLTALELARIYKECDEKCRDPLGRLLDLEHRIQTFIELVGLYSGESTAKIAK